MTQCVVKVNFHVRKIGNWLLK